MHLRMDKSCQPTEQEIWEKVGRKRDVRGAQNYYTTSHTCQASSLSTVHCATRDFTRSRFQAQYIWFIYGIYLDHMTCVYMYNTRLNDLQSIRPIANYSHP